MTTTCYSMQAAVVAKLVAYAGHTLTDGGSWAPYCDWAATAVQLGRRSDVLPDAAPTLQMAQCGGTDSSRAYATGHVRLFEVDCGGHVESAEGVTTGLVLVVHQLRVRCWWQVEDQNTRAAGKLRSQVDFDEALDVVRRYLTADLTLAGTAVGGTLLPEESEPTIEPLPGTQIQCHMVEFKVAATERQAGMVVPSVAP